MRVSCFFRCGRFDSYEWTCAFELGWCFDDARLDAALGNFSVALGTSWFYGSALCHSFVWFFRRSG